MIDMLDKVVIGWLWLWSLILFGRDGKAVSEVYCSFLSRQVGIHGLYQPKDL